MEGSLTQRHSRASLLECSAEDERSCREQQCVNYEQDVKRCLGHVCELKVTRSINGNMSICINMQTTINI